MRKAVASSFLLAAAAAACSASSTDSPESTGKDTQDLAGIMAWAWLPSNGIAGSPQWTVPVCWDATYNDPRTFTTQRQWVRDAVEGAWAKVAHVNFVGWDTICAPAGGDPYYNRTVRIGIKDDRSWSNYGTSALFGSPHAMELNLEFKLWEPGGADCRSTQAKTKFCTQDVAVHEFGHLLGWIHEQDSPANKGACAADTNPPGGVTGLTTYDPFSTMNYCAPNYQNGGVLSAGDIVGTRMVYGTKPTKSIVTFSGKCFDVTAFDNFEGAPVQTWDCNGYGNQQWTIDPNDGTIGGWGTASGIGGPRVLSASSNTPAIGEQVVMRSPSLYQAQKLALGTFNILGYGDLCLDVMQTIGGFFVTLNQCNGSTTQQWYVAGPGITNAAYRNSCIGVSGPQSNLVIGSCPAGGAYTLQLKPGGTIQAAQLPGKCIDAMVGGGTLASAASTPPYNAYIASSCTGNQSQAFHIRGALHAGSGNMCLDVRAFGENVGTAMQWWTCNGMSNQSFDLYY